MAQALIAGCRIAGIAAAVPGLAHTAADLERDLGEPVTRLTRATGIAERRRAPAGMTASDMCLAAAEDLIEGLGWARDSIDALLFVSQTPDYRLPATACTLQHRLGLSAACAAFDVGLGCSGYVYGLWNAGALIAGGGARRVLVLVGDTISHHIDVSDRSVAGLFGDAGTATALEAAGADEVLACVVGTDGSGAQDLIIKGGGERHAGGDVSNRLFMNGAGIFNFTMERVPPLVADTLRLAGWSAGEVDLALFHQANQMLIEQLARKSGLRPEQTPIGLQQFGNTSGATVPLLCVSRLADRLAEGPARVLMAGFGVGLSFGAVATTLDGLVIPPLRSLQQADAA